jgi:imidazolonepropionase-like amidohydrolase
VTVFEGARLIVGDSSAPVEDSAFIVENAKFSRIGKRGELEVPAGAARVDLTGKTVMPALVDSHIHIGFNKGLTFELENFTRENVIDHLNRMAYYGVAATMSMGTDPGDLPFQLRDESHPGALYLTTGRGLRPPKEKGPTFSQQDVTYMVSSEEEARQDVRELAAKKVNIVKIWVDDSRGREPKLSPVLYRAIIDEAHKNSMRVVAHITYLDDAKDLLRAGIDGFVHPVRDKDIDDEFMELLKQRPHVFFNPNLGNTDRGTYVEKPAWIDDPLLRETVSPELLKRAGDFYAARTVKDTEDSRETYARMQRTIAKLNAAGVLIALGTDTGPRDQFFGYTSQRELELMVAAGMTPAQVIVAATRTPAEILGIGERLGTVAAGKSADFLVLDANPLDNIANTRRIASVYLRGEELDRAALRAAWNRLFTTN